MPDKPRIASPASQPAIALRASLAQRIERAALRRARHRARGGARRHRASARAARRARRASACGQRAERARQQRLEPQPQLPWPAPPRRRRCRPRPAPASRSSRLGTVKSHSSGRSTTLTSTPRARRRAQPPRRRIVERDEGQPRVARSSSPTTTPPARSTSRRLASAASPSPSTITGWPAMRWNSGRLRSSHQFAATPGTRSAAMIVAGLDAVGDHREAVAVDHAPRDQRAAVVARRPSSRHRRRRCGTRRGRPPRPRRCRGPSRRCRRSRRSGRRCWRSSARRSGATASKSCQASYSAGPREVVHRRVDDHERVPLTPRLDPDHPGQQHAGVAGDHPAGLEHQRRRPSRAVTRATIAPYSAGLGSTSPAL